MKNNALLRGLYRLTNTGNTCAAFGKALERCQGLLLANDDPDLTEYLASVLLIESRNYPLAADWFDKEMMFETYVAEFGLSRRQVALDALHNGEISDDALDLYNARMSRFAIETPAHVSG